MRISNFEQRAAETPAVLICDECDFNDICKWCERIHAAVVACDNAIRDTPLSITWACKRLAEKGGAA